MKKIKIVFSYIEKNPATVEKINTELAKYGLQIVAVDEKEKVEKRKQDRVYFPEERARDGRLDCTVGHW